MFRVGRHTGGGNIGHTFGLDSTDERSITRALIWARKSLPEYERYYKKYLKGFEQMELVATASQLGCPRKPPDSRRLRAQSGGLQDRGRSSPTRSAATTTRWTSTPPSPTWPATSGTPKISSKLRYGKGESYGIPYRCLGAAEADQRAGGRPLRQHRPLHAELDPRDARLLHHRPGDRRGRGDLCQAGLRRGASRSPNCSAG